MSHLLHFMQEHLDSDCSLTFWTHWAATWVHQELSGARVKGHLQQQTCDAHLEPSRSNI